MPRTYLEDCHGKKLYHIPDTDEHYGADRFHRPVFYNGRVRKIRQPEMGSGDRQQTGMDADGKSRIHINDSLMDM